MYGSAHWGKLLRQALALSVRVQVGTNPRPEKLVSCVQARIAHMNTGPKKGSYQTQVLPILFSSSKDTPEFLSTPLHYSLFYQT